MKWHGRIGFGQTVKTSPGVWTEQITTRTYSGEVLKSARRYQTSENINDNLTISNRISIIADTFASVNQEHMKYVEYMGAKWKITEIEVSFPRLILTVGGVYNEQE